MAYSLKKQSSHSRNAAIVFLVFLICFSLLAGCGLPSVGDIADPPFNINDEVFRVTFNVRNSHAVAIYYRFISAGSTVEQNFGNITTNGEQALASRGYSRTNDLDVYVWVPSGPVTDPVNLFLEYASFGNDAKLTVTDAGGTVFFSNKILLRDSRLSAPNVSFLSPLSAYKDTATLGSGPVDVALAAISYKLNPTTMQLLPSIPQFLGYMRGLQIR